MHYLPPDMWMYVNHYTLKGEIEPEYRDRDKRWHIFTKYCELDTTTFKNIDPKTQKPIKNEGGEYDMIDLGYRVCYGSNISKHRQAGDSSKVQSSHLNFITARIAEHSQQYRERMMRMQTICFNGIVYILIPSGLSILSH